jgi:hypothetical protein|nr:MAG TPA: hypothetical protein [Inoviridae sp.]
MKTVKWILLSLNLNPYTHIVIRRHTERGVDMLGGSDKVSVILQRFGSLYVENSYITSDGILIMYVKEI